MKFYKLDQVAEIMQMNTETVRRYIRRGELKAGLFGREYRVIEEDLREFYESKKTAS
jgi:excisionase family DNA binding protein